MLAREIRIRRVREFALALFAAVVLACGAASSVSAHGVELEQSRGEAVEITATYDNGDPMSEGQVVVYSPEEPSEPWTTGTTDEQGRYVFIPDASKPGAWSVQVREAGHGANISVEVGGEKDSGVERVETEQTSSAGGSAARTGLMVALGLWGFVGTALFFQSRRR